MTDDANAPPDDGEPESIGISPQESSDSDSDSGFEPDSSQPIAPAAPTSRVERLRIAAAKARKGLDDKRETSRVVGVAFDTFGEEVQAGGPVLSAALGFRVFLFFAPLIAFVVLILSLVADVADKDPHDLIRGKGVAALMATAITVSSDASVATRIAIFVLVAYALVLSARSFVKVLRIVHILVWHESPTPMKNATRAALILIVLSLIACGVAAAIDALREHQTIGGIVALGLFTLVPFVVWFDVSWWLAHGTSDRLGLLPGAAVFALGAEALHIATVIWFPHLVRSKSEVYGALGIALVLLLWAYLVGRLITIAAALNRALYLRRRADPVLPDFVAEMPVVGGWNRQIWAWLTARS